MQQAQTVFEKHAHAAALAPAEARMKVTDSLKLCCFDAGTFAGAAGLAQEIALQLSTSGTMRKIQTAAVQNVRNTIYLAGETVRLMPKGAFSQDEQAVLAAFKASLDKGTRFIPWWVKVAVAIALGMGTMVGWKRIVVTVGEKIGKTHLTYGQGASAERVAAATIAAADMYGLPVSTTHVLSSGIAGTMAANGSGLQWSTVKSIAMAWVLTLPAAMLLAYVLTSIFIRRVAPWRRRAVFPVMSCRMAAGIVCQPARISGGSAVSGTVASARRRVEMINGSLYLLDFVRNLRMQRAAKTLLVKPFGVRQGIAGTI